MTPRIDPRDPPWRSPARGAAFLYVFPVANDSLLKLGFSCDPLDRLQSLHQRYYEFFDLDDALLVATDTVREARALELRLGRELAASAAPAPLTVATAAGGHTEWYRGALDHLHAASENLRAAGHVVHRPLRDWLRRRLAERGALLFHWSATMLEAIEMMQPHDGLRIAEPGPPTPIERTLRNALDAYGALDLPLEPLVSETVLAWHRNSLRRF